MKRKILTTIQIIVTVLILGWLFRDPETNRKMLEALGSANLLWIAASFASFGVMRFLSVIRWQILLRVQGVNISMLRLSGLTLIGLFFNIFMPGGTGGDVVKSFYLLREAPGKKAEALLSVMMDRLIGLIMMFVIAGLVLYFRHDWLMSTPATSGLVAIFGIVVAGCLAFIIGSFAVTGLGLVHRLPEKLPLRNKLVDMAVGYNLYARAWKPTLFTLALSVPVHLFSFAQFYCAARAFQGIADKISFVDFLAIMPIVATLISVPVSVGGTGVREGLFVKLLGDLCGIGVATATVVSLAGYLVQVLWGVIGGIVYLTYRSTAPIPAEAVPVATSSDGLEPTPAGARRDGER
jgi:uncharacterized protein (TIRG00374 family)